MNLTKITCLLIIVTLTMGNMVCGMDLVDVTARKKSYAHLEKYQENNWPVVPNSLKKINESIWCQTLMPPMAMMALCKLYSWPDDFTGVVGLATFIIASYVCLGKITYEKIYDQLNPEAMENFVMATLSNSNDEALDSVGPKGKTAITIAAQKNLQTFFNELLARGANLAIKDRDDKNCFDYIRQNWSLIRMVRKNEDRIRKQSEVKLLKKLYYLFEDYPELPNELLLHIASFLDLNDFLMLALDCKVDYKI